MTFQPSNAFRPPLDENVSFSTEWDQFLEQITRRYRDIAREVNTKERAFYPLEEILSAQKWFNPNNVQQFRSSFRKVFTFTPPTLVFPHGITQIAQFTRIYGTCIAAGPTYLPIPYSSTTAVANQIEVFVDATQIHVIIGGAVPAVTSGLIVLEYLKS